MTGPEGAAAAVVAIINAKLPAVLATIRAELALPAEADLPPPKLVTAQERDLLNLGQWPAIFVVVQRLDRIRRDTALEDGSVRYVARYPVRIFLFVRGDSYEDTDLLRKRYVRAVREVVLNTQEDAQVDETGYAESYSDVGLDEAKRSIAGAWVEFPIELTEDLAPPPGTPTPAPEPDGWDFVVDGHHQASVAEELTHPALD